MTRRDVSVMLPLMGAGTAFVSRLVDALPDDALAAPSGLPGWTRAHVVAHLARNADALGRLATWARTGVETPMYAGPEQRAAEIESSAQAAPAVLRAELTAAAQALDAALATLDDRAWHAEVRSALGRVIPATEIPWMRVREVWLHAVDLDTGARVADLPVTVVDALLDDVTAVLSTRDGCPVAVLDPSDRDRTWELGTRAGSPVVRGTAAAVVGWLVGRTEGADLTAVAAAGEPAAIPVAPRWL